VTETLTPSQALPNSSGGLRVPDFFIVGQPKCGTTAMYEILRTHPQIFMPEQKEPSYLASELHWRFTQLDSWVPPDLSSYLSLFSPASPHQVVGEASTIYFFSEAAPQEIAALNSQARVIALVREPIALLHAIHTHQRREHVETVRSLNRTLALEPVRRAGRHIPRSPYPPEVLFYSTYVRYVEHLRRFEAALSRDQILIIVYDDFLTDNPGTISNVLRFLGVDDTWPVPTLTANRSVRLRSQVLHRGIRGMQFGQDPVSQAAKAVIPAPLRAHLLGGLYRHVLYGSPRPLPPRLVRQLKRSLRPRVVELSEYLQRDLLRLWGYEDA
jgi:hypothetical protein